MIRYARFSDHEAIAALVEAAFSRPAEAKLVTQLRADQDAMVELVAEDAGVLQGHILLSSLWADRYELYAGLAPLSVRPADQKRGVGSALVRAALVSAREFGAHGVLVLGDPGYYSRFGFAAKTAARVRGPWRGLPAFQAVALEPGAFDRPLSVAYPDAFARARARPAAARAWAQPARP